MNLLTISRIFAFILFINEAFVVIRTPPEERNQIILPPLPLLAFLLLFLPFFVVIDLPQWLALVVIIVQVCGLVMELFSEFQLYRAKSFSVLSDKGTQVQTGGFYRWFEHPIYVGIILQMLGWSLYMPLVFVAVILNYVAVRKMVRNERDYLAKTLNFSHRGIDTALWN